MADIFQNRTVDSLLSDIESLKEHEGLSEVITKYQEGDFAGILENTTSQRLFETLRDSLSVSSQWQNESFPFIKNDSGIGLVLLTGLSSFNLFLQVNVTGPPVRLSNIFSMNHNAEISRLKEQLLRSLDVDGVSVYQYIPHIELFCLARLVFNIIFPRSINGKLRDCKWMRIRVNVYHMRLLSNMAGGRLSESSALQDAIEKDLKDLEKEIMGPSTTYGTETKVQFLLEKVQIYIMEGLEVKARDNVKKVSQASGFKYHLSGAMGKRTRFQQNDISQLVVLAKTADRSTSNSDNPSNGEANGDFTTGRANSALRGPMDLDLNDDTLLESIAFSKNLSNMKSLSIPPELAELQPDNQPQLDPLDQITLLAEASYKDNFSPLDKLNSEEILPYAVRVISDKPTNWQIYTQALLIRSRIESHRSRTQERSVLQLQAIVDQVIADTQQEDTSSTGEIPEIRVAQFLPRAKAGESAPVAERLKYIFQLNAPTRWELETELAYAWSAAGSLVSALEIFKRLRLWAEVALCYHSVNQEEKARQVIRRQLYFSSKGPEMDNYSIDANETVAETWHGEIRDPPPPHASRLWCILGDLDQDPLCWERAWTISKHRYARAQRTLGEYYTRKGDLERARNAYMKATVVNRQNNDTWSRLGDIDLKIGNWDGAIIAFQQSVMIDDTDAKTYSNLGSALLSKHAELATLRKSAVQEAIVDATGNTAADEELTFSSAATDPVLDPKSILRQALNAYKRAAALAHDNWQIWDNVITIAGRMQPPSFPEILMGMRAVLRIRAPSVGEMAVDVDILRLIIQEVTGQEHERGEGAPTGGIYEPPRGSLARATVRFVEDDVVPLVTKRTELWALVERLAFWRRDYMSALKCAERAWRIATGGEAWLTKRDEWKGVVRATEHLVSAYEGYGPLEVLGEDGADKVVEKGWKGKAKSAVRTVMGRGRDAWEGDEEWAVLEGLMDEMKV